MPGILRPLRIAVFARLALTYTANELADWMATIALSVLVYDATRDPFATTALFLASKFLPGLLVPVLAARLDRLPTARLLGGLYAAEAIALGALAAFAGAFLLPLVLALALLAGALAATARATTRAATVGVLEPRDALREGNACLNLGFAAMNAGGPIAAGALVALTGPATVLGTAAALFAVQAAVMGTARGLPDSEPEAAPWGARLREGLAYVAHDVRLRTLLGGQALVLLLLTIITPIEVVYAKESLGVGDAGFGTLLASWGVGMVLGSWLFARERRRPLPVLIVLATTAMAMGYLGMAVAPTLLSACAASVLGGMGNGVQWVAVVTALQEATDERFQTRIAGLLEAVMAAAPGVGFLIGGTVTALLSPRAAFALSGAGVLVVLLVGLLALARARDRPVAVAELGGRL